LGHPCRNPGSGTDLGDAPDANLGNTACATATNTCTLRAAITQAATVNTVTTIVVPAGTITLGSQILVNPATTSGLTIQGATADTTIIKGNGTNARVFQINDGRTVTLTKVTIRDGAPTSSSGGGILTQNATLTLDDVVVKNNHVSSRLKTILLDNVHNERNGALAGAADPSAVLRAPGAGH